MQKTGYRLIRCETCGNALCEVKTDGIIVKRHGRVLHVPTVDNIYIVCERCKTKIKLTI